MMSKEMCIDLASPDKERMFKYKAFAQVFSYPKKKELALEYDRLFRTSEVWLYGAEYIAENEFQRVQALSDINGFYKAFGLEPDKDRPDSLPCELEFMHYLIFKKARAPDDEKAVVCTSAQKKFFNEHLFPAAKRIAEKIIAQVKNNFYIESAKGLLKFLEEEQDYFNPLRGGGFRPLGRKGSTQIR